MSVKQKRYLHSCIFPAFFSTVTENFRREVFCISSSIGFPTHGSTYRLGVFGCGTAANHTTQTQTLRSLALSLQRQHSVAFSILAHFDFTSCRAAPHFIFMGLVFPAENQPHPELPYLGLRKLKSNRDYRTSFNTFAACDRSLCSKPCYRTP